MGQLTPQLTEKQTAVSRVQLGQQTDGIPILGNYDE